MTKSAYIKAFSGGGAGLQDYRGHAYIYNYTLDAYTEGFCDLTTNKRTPS